jgi:hypothetical protein
LEQLVVVHPVVLRRLGFFLKLQLHEHCIPATAQPSTAYSIISI